LYWHNLAVSPLEDEDKKMKGGLINVTRSNEMLTGRFNCGWVLWSGISFGIDRLFSDAIWDANPEARAALFSTQHI